MLRFSHPVLMRAAWPIASNGGTSMMSRGAFAMSTYTAVQQQQRFFNSRPAAAQTSIAASPMSRVCPTPASAPLKEQRMSFVSGTRSWLARNRSGTTTSSTTPSSSMWGSSVVQNNTPDTYSSNASAGGEVLTPAVREHLMKVYNLLAVAIGCASLGSAAMIMTPLGKAIPWFVPCFGGLVPLLWLWFKPPANPIARQALVLSFAGLQGMAIAPIVKATAAAGVLGSALVMTGAVFAGFSAAAFLAPRASLVAFQGPLMGLFFGMFAISLLNMIWPTAFAHSLILYGGLALFSAFVAVDTQVMIERARCGEGDVAFDALNMFTNVLQIFIRIAQILRSMSE